MTITMMIDHINMHCSINMYNQKRLYRFILNNWSYIDYDDDGFNIKECDFKGKTAAVM